MFIQPNILLDESGRARITNFGLAAITQDLDYSSSASFDLGDAARWTAPEILKERGAYTKKADVFSFAMVIIEVRYSPPSVYRAFVHYHRYSPGWSRSMVAGHQRLYLQ